MLAAFLNRFDTGGLGTNLDPANLLLHDFDPSESVRALRGKVVHARATDARYAGASCSTQEVPLGDRDVGWERYLGVLEEIEYRGWLTVEGAGGGNRVAAVAAGVGYLRRFVGSPG